MKKRMTLFAVMAVMPWVSAPAAEPSHPALLPAQRWALSLSAPLSLTNSENMDTLSGKPDTFQARHVSQYTLAGWGVYDRSDLIDQLEGLARRGHSVAFTALATRTPEEQVADDSLALREYDVRALHRAELVREYGETFGDRSLAAWDYSRYVSLCRWGYTGGYFTEEEAWTHILAAARTVQPLFSSWEEFAENYYVGYRFYSLTSWLEDSGSRYLYLQQMLHDPDSPWVQLPWGTNLNEK